MIFSNETNATNCVSLYIRQWDSKADLYGLVRGVRLRFHSIVKVTSKKSNPYLVTTLFSKVDILDASPYVDVATTSGYSGQTGNEAELTFLSDLTENSKTSAIKCLFTVDRLLKLSISANCNFCGNIIKNEGSIFDFQNIVKLDRNFLLYKLFFQGIMKNMKSMEGHF